MPNVSGAAAWRPLLGAALTESRWTTHRPCLRLDWIQLKLSAAPIAVTTIGRKPEIPETRARPCLETQ